MSKHKKRGKQVGKLKSDELCNISIPKEFQKRYSKYLKLGIGPLYMHILADVKTAALESDISNLEVLDACVNYLKALQGPEIKQNFCDDINNPLKTTNLVILVCKNSCIKVLKYLFSSGHKTLVNLPHVSRKILPEDEDEEKHNAFYYAIRSNDLQLLELLISKWPGDYFEKNPELLDSILAKAYEELKLKQVLLSDAMDIFVADKLVNLRFFSDSIQTPHEISFDIINERIEFLIENVNLLRIEYKVSEVDEKFLQVAKFIVRTVNYLKQQLKCTYDVLPWEEIEFCLIAFVVAYQNNQEINFVYKSVLSKHKVLTYLGTFTKHLHDMKNTLSTEETSKLVEFPDMEREEAVLKISRSSDVFAELCKDYKVVRDIHSMETIHKYAVLAVSADSKEKEGQLLIMRSLQVVGEHLKNTLGSPKLCDDTSEFVFSSFPQNVKQMLSGIRNSFSHAFTLAKRSEIQRTVDISYFSNIQNDIENINILITDILNDCKLKIVETQLKKIVDSETQKEIAEIAETFSSADLFIPTTTKLVPQVENKVVYLLPKLIKRINNKLTDKTHFEKELFREIEELIDFEKSNLNVNVIHFQGLSILKSVYVIWKNEALNESSISSIKNKAKELLKKMSSPTKNGLQRIATLLLEIYDNFSSYMDDETIYQVERMLALVSHFVNLNLRNVKWIEELSWQIHMNKYRKNFIGIKTDLKEGKSKSCDQLQERVQMLQDVLQNNMSGSDLYKDLQCCEKSEVLPIIEMLLLDILSVLGDNFNCLTENRYLLEDNCPLLIGKSLRNHLAHGNAVGELLSVKPSRAVTLSALIFSTYSVTDRRKIGKIIQNEGLFLKTKLEQNIMTLFHQKKLFQALEKGDLEVIKSCINNGADIYARGIDLQTTLHFAAKAPNVDAIKFVVDQRVNVEAKDVDGQSPLHVAAKYGRKSVVEYLIRKTNANVNNTDNFGKTCLHIAAQNGYLHIVQVLIINKANINLTDCFGLTPLFCAVKNNHKDIVSLLLQQEKSIDVPKVLCGFSLLHFAAENGNLEFTKLFLRNGADVNRKTDQGAEPLHLATVYGHLSVVDALISAGGNVNAVCKFGTTPLHNAVEFGHKKVLDLLLKNGACVNILGYSNYTPLTFAAIGGDLEILKSLLEHGASVDSQTTGGLTALHLAATEGHYNAVEILLKTSAFVNAKDKKGYSVLHLSAQNGHKHIVDLLIDYGAKVDDRTNDCMTPLHLATVNNKLEVVKKLLMAGACVNLINKKNMSPLHFSCQEGFLDVTNTLIENGACVNVRDIKNRTPLHYAVISGAWEISVHLLTQGAQLHEKDITGHTALHYAAHCGETRILKTLINENVGSNARNMKNQTPLHLAVIGNHKEAVEMLLDDGAEANVLDINSNTPLSIAINNNNKEVVSLLISKNVNVSENNLVDAVSSGCTDIVMMLLKNGHINLNVMVDNEMTLLCTAISEGLRAIVQILLSKGANVNYVSASGNLSPLHVATAAGYKDIVQMLLDKNANVNIQSIEGSTPLHFASIFGFIDVVQILVNAGADVNLKDHKNRTGLEFAVAYNNLNIVEKLAKFKNVDINAKGNDDFTLLHIAAQLGRLEITKFLLRCGANVYAKNCSGSMPIHIAAREGHVPVVDFYLSFKVDINVRGAANQTLLHYATIFGEIDVAKYLTSKKIKINASDDNGRKPIHVASASGCKEMVIFLLENGASYDVVDNSSRTPVMVTQSRDIATLLKSIEDLFDGVRSNNYEKVCESIMAGARIDVKNINDMTPLHYAACKGYEKIVCVLLQNKADPNVVGKDAWRPLHYAAKFSHLNIVKLLLIHGAMYNMMNDSCKTPCDIADNGKIIELLQKIKEVHTKVKNGNTSVFEDLRTLDVDTMKIIIKTSDREGKTLLVIAIHNDFPLLKRLEAIIQADTLLLKIEAQELSAKEKYQDALRVYENVLEKQRHMLGTDNPCSLDTEHKLAMLHYKQQDYSRALDIFRDVHKKQKRILGPDDKNTLETRGHIALTLHRQGNNEEALHIFKEVCQKEEEILGVNHIEVLSSQIHMGLVLNGLQKYEEALLINNEVYEKSKKMFGFTHHSTLSAYNNIAMVLSNQGKLDEALNIFKNIFEKRKSILGQTHSVTLRTLHRMSQIHMQLQNYDTALQMLDHIFNSQKSILGLNNILTLQTWCEIADIFLLSKNNFQKALEIYKEILVHRKILLGPWHPDVSSVAEKINIIEMAYAFTGNISIRTEEPLLEQAKLRVASGDKEAIEDLLMQGLDVNQTDSEGRTLLHYATDKAKNFIVSFLLEKKVDCTKISRKGNTPLHIASSKGYDEIVEILLQHVRMFCENKLQDFVNAKTLSSCSTALHVAANIKIVKALLKCGAMFNILNKEGKKPIDLSSDPAIISLLKLLEFIFENVSAGNPKVIGTLLHMGRDTFAVITNCQNREGKTLSQIAVLRNHQHIVHALKEISQRREVDVNEGNNEYYNAMLQNDYHLKERNSIDDLCKFIIGKDPSDPFHVLRNAERFMIHSKHVYDQAVKVYKRLLHLQESCLEISIFIIFLELRELLSEEGGEDFGMCRDISKCNFHNAASEGEEYVLKKFLSEGYDINKRDNKGRTPLHYAAHNAQNFIVYFLLENEADCSLSSDKGNTALHIASSKGHGEIVEILLQHMKQVNGEKLYAFVNSKTSFGNTALHVAANARITTALLSYGAIYNVPNNAGQLPVDLLIDQEVVHIFKLLDKLFEYVCNGNPQALVILSQLNPVEFTAIANARNHEGKTLIQLAAIKHHHNITFMLISTLKSSRNLEETRILKDFSVNKHEREIAQVHKYIEYLHTDLSNVHHAQLRLIQNYFIQHQNMYDMTIKAYATILETLGLDLKSDNALNELKSEASVKCSSGADVLHRTVHKAAEEGDEEALGNLLVDRFDIDGRDSEGNTPLHCAVRNSQKSMVNFLLAKGANCILVSNHGNTPLHIASSKGDTDIVEILIDHVKINNNCQLDTLINKQITSSGNTALHIAANFDIAKILLKNGGIYNIINKDGNTPIELLQEKRTLFLLELIDDLFRDAYRGNLNIIEKLKECSYDHFTFLISTLNNKQKTVLNVLEDGKHNNILSQIRQVHKTSRHDFSGNEESSSGYSFEVSPIKFAPAENWASWCELL